VRHVGVLELGRASLSAFGDVPDLESPADIGRNRETLTLDLIELDIRWPYLPSPIVNTKQALARSQASFLSLLAMELLAGIKARPP
jgi:hypothetical protein